MSAQVDSRRLHISPELALPVDAVTETFAILAVKRAGKSNAAVVMAEEMCDAGVPWVAIDPKGDWWGVRSAGDGNSPGLSVLVLGGLHGDVPLEPTAGRLVADLVVEQRLTCVLDVSEMAKADQRRFLIDFADRLYRSNTEPLHVFCEEADEYIPQRVMGENAKLVGVFETLVKRGGFRGIGITLITQRSASLNKDVLTQAGTLIAMRTPSPQDRKAVLAWVDYHDTGRDLVDQLPTLEAGQAWVFSPQWLKTVQRIQFRRRRTFDSGATPKVGEKRRQPTRLADVDLAAIKEAMADTIERAAADDPKILRKRILTLLDERDAARAATARAEQDLVEFKDTARNAILTAWQKLQPYFVASRELLVRLGLWEQDIPTKEGEGPDARQDLPRAQPASAPAVPVGSGRRTAERPDPPARRDAGRTAVQRPAAAQEGLSLPAAQRALLDALAWYVSVGLAPADRTQLALFAGVSPKSSGYANNLGALRTAGLIDYPSKGRVALTDAGELQAEVAATISTSEELQEALFRRLPEAQVRILRALIAVFPVDVGRVDLAEQIGVSPVSSGYANNLGALRTLGLIDYPAKGWVRATDALFLGGGR